MGNEEARRAEPSPAWVLWPFEEGPRAGQTQGQGKTSGAQECGREAPQSEARAYPSLADDLG